MLEKEPSEIRSYFKEYGYHFAKSVYSVDEIQSMEKDFDRALGQILDTEKRPNARWGGKLMDEIDGGDSVLLHTHNIQSYSAVWLNAFMKSEFLDVAEAILGPDIILHHSKLFCKPPEKGSPFPMHQDWQYFPSVKDTMIAAVIYVSEATDEMGCIRVHPGSHKLGRCQGTMGNGQNAEVTDNFALDEGTVLEAKPGDVLFFSYFTLHGSMPNQSGKTRKSVLVQMYAGDDEIEADNMHTNVRLVLRGWNRLATRANVGEIR
ncbi:MAG: phytanoyl-CoA dioxygenase family protein [Candidatus Poribacteria bacterium]|nr:phytanoyl-CoA dioxygenase family protein [Candidatus Poribacteria bacterium]MDE0504107.1 phytanoyl-CoA dioxygenase family protein [Candidatus Poribacteria bacterium]